MMTDPFDLTPLDTSTLDAAYRLFHNGSCHYNAALSAMLDCGVTMTEARRLLDAPQPPSRGYLAVAR